MNLSSGQARLMRTPLVESNGPQFSRMTTVNQSRTAGDSIIVIVLLRSGFLTFARLHATSIIRWSGGMTEVVDGHRIRGGVRRLCSPAPVLFLTPHCGKDPVIASQNRSSAVRWCCGSIYCLECWDAGILLFNCLPKIRLVPFHSNTPLCSCSTWGFS